MPFLGSAGYRDRQQQGGRNEEAPVHAPLLPHVVRHQARPARAAQAVTREKAERENAADRDRRRPHPPGNDQPKRTLARVRCERSKPPIMPKPPSIIAQLAGSGTEDRVGRERRLRADAEGEEMAERQLKAAAGEIA